MDTSRGKMIYNEEKMEDDQEEEDREEEEDDDDAGLIRYGGDYHQAERKKSSRTLTRNRSSGGGLTMTRPPPSCSCQVEDCRADMSISKPYHRRHKVCEVHSKAPVVLLSGLHQRFCQQCSRFHVLAEFDEAKRSCRRRLAGHNERRRKISSEYHGEGGSS